jgi:hypothetical protein
MWCYSDTVAVGEGAGPKYTVANPQRGLIWNVNFPLYPTKIVLLLDLFSSPYIHGKLYMYGAEYEMHVTNK